MAILPGVPSIEVSIISGGRTLLEYPDDAEFTHRSLTAPKDRISTVYIECDSDKEFSIKYVVTPRFVRAAYHTDVTFWAVVDGKKIGGKVNRYSALGWNFSQTVAVSRVNDHEVVEQKLRFSSLRKVDDDDSHRVKSDVKLANGLGEIIVHVHRTLDSRVIAGSHRHTTHSSISEIAEKALKGKAISHGVSFGEEVRVPKALDCEMVYPDGESTPLGIFRFKYRSREALKQEMIIPRSPSPEVLMGAANPVSLQERLARLKREIEHVKSEASQEAALPRGQKRELDEDDVQIVSNPVFKSSRRATGKLVIDLTDD